MLVNPALWDLLPEYVDPEVEVPPWPKFMQGCITYRRSLDDQLKDAAVVDVEFEEWQRRATDE